MPRLLDALYLLLLCLLSPWLVYRSWRTRRYRRGLSEKLFGHAARPAPPHPQPVVWFHAVSVGEVHLLRQLVGAFRRRHTCFTCVISTTTETGFDEARKWFPDLTVFFFPFDFSWAVRKTFAALRPALVVLTEAELWPNFLLAARRAAVPVAVVNGRMSPRSLARYRRLGALSRWLVRQPDLLAMSSADYGRAVVVLGAPPGRVAVTGNIKYDGATAARDNPRTAALRQLFGIAADDLVLVAGSTQPVEEEALLTMFPQLREHYPNLRLILVPRQHERFEPVAEALKQRGYVFGRMTRPESYSPPPPVILLDTFGELSAAWGLADVAFVGGSLCGTRGGQNMIEPAACGAAVLFGPHTWNFREPVRQLLHDRAAVEVPDAVRLEAEILRLLGDAAERLRMGEAARAFVRRQQGATERTVALLDGLLAARYPDRVAA